MGAETLRQYFHSFVADLKYKYGSMYLKRHQDTTEISEIVEDYDKIVFSGFIGALDCCHISWKIYGGNLKGQYNMKNNGKLGMLVAEALCVQGLYIWSSFTGLPGTNNDLYVLYSSPLFHETANDSFSFKITPYYMVCDSVIPNRDISCILADGIYPGWRIFSFPISDPTAQQEQYKLAQESVRNDIENAFGVLTGRFQVLENGLRFWNMKKW